MYTRKDLHKDLDELLDEHGLGDDLSMFFGQLLLEVHFQKGKVETTFQQRRSIRKSMREEKAVVTA